MINPIEDPITLREILTYDEVEGSRLKPGERIAIHQWIGQGIQLSAKIKNKILEYHKEITREKWEAPECRYNADRELEVQNYQGKNWKLLKAKIN